MAAFPGMAELVTAIRHKGRGAAKSNRSVLPKTYVVSADKSTVKLNPSLPAIDEAPVMVTSAGL
jgi:hypothetical protein